MVQNTYPERAGESKQCYNQEKRWGEVPGTESEVLMEMEVKKAQIILTMMVNYSTIFQTLTTWRVSITIAHRNSTLSSVVMKSISTRSFTSYDMEGLLLFG